jgi:hypothetical protein
MAAVSRRGYGEDGIYFDRRAGCRDSAHHKTCSGRWRGVVSLGFGADGNGFARRSAAGAGIVGQLVDRVQDVAYALRVVEERGRLADRSFAVIDPQAHRCMPSRRRASSAGTNVVWPSASRALHSSTAAVSSASSSS